MNSKQRTLPFILSTIFLVLLILNCNQDKTLLRATNDYFPLQTGIVWYYLSGDETTKVEVVGDSTIFGQFSYVIYRNLAEEYWLKDKTAIRKLVQLVTTNSGFTDTLEQRFRQYFQLPFISGNSWTEDFYDTIILHSGDQIYFKHRICGNIVALEHSLITPAGEFSDVYKLMLVDTIQRNDSLSTKTSYYWLAPDFGIVKQRFEAEDTIEQVLISFKSLTDSLP
jgi:hypothetical protein